MGQQNKIGFEDGQKLAMAIGRRAELQSLKLESRETTAELRGLNEYISRTFNEHAEQFIASWFVIETEYDPLVTGFSALLRRGTAINQQRLGQQLAQQKQLEAEMAKLPVEPEPATADDVAPPLNVVPVNFNGQGQGIVVAPNI